MEGWRGIHRYLAKAPKLTRGEEEHDERGMSYGARIDLHAARWQVCVLDMDCMVAAVPHNSACLQGMWDARNSDTGQ